jgi:HTH-type transcriptional regulator / antitoxin HipB
VLLRTPREIGLRIRDRRMQLGMSQAQLAERIGMSRQWVVSLEKGAPGAALGTVLRAISELGLDVNVRESNMADDIIEVDGQPVPLALIRTFVDSVGSPADNVGGTSEGEPPEGRLPRRTPLRLAKNS